MRRLPHEEIGLQIAPMIDVTLLLLFFFMLSGRLTQGARLQRVNVPIASALKQPDRGGERDVINISREGEWFAGDIRVSKAELSSHLRSRFEHHPPLKLHVRADAATPAAKIKELIAMAADAGAIEVVYGVRAP